MIARQVIAQYRETGRIPLRLIGVDKYLYPGLQGLGQSRYALYYPNDMGVHVIEVITLAIHEGTVSGGTSAVGDGATVERAVRNALEDQPDPLFRNGRKFRWIHRYLSNLQRLKANEIPFSLAKSGFVGPINIIPAIIPELFRRVG